MIKVETISVNIEIIIPNFQVPTIITVISTYAIELPRISIAKSRKFRERERLTASDTSGEISFVALARWIMQQRVRNTEDDLKVHGHGNSATGKGVKERSTAPFSSLYAGQIHPFIWHEPELTIWKKQFWLSGIVFPLKGMTDIF